MTATRNNRGACHENGSIESPHGHVKQRLLARGSAEFPSVAAYQDFLDTVTAAVNRRNATAIEAERPHLRPLPATAAADYTELWVKVTTASTITVRLVVYSVPARLIGERLRMHLYDAPPGAVPRHRGPAQPPAGLPRPGPSASTTAIWSAGW
jgi:hypothetical protein